MGQHQHAAYVQACALLDLKGDRLQADENDLAEAVGEVVSFFAAADIAISPGELRKKLEQRYVVAYEEIDVAVGCQLSSAWFGAKEKADWKHWWRYHDLMSSDRSPVVMKAMDEMTDRVMAAIGDPLSADAFCRMGIVYGDIQSGKTANMIAVLAKAASSGFRVCVVLAGMEEDLRTQTQLRVDAGLVGASFHKGEHGSLVPTYVGVGKDARRTFASPLTTLDSDLSLKVSVPPAGDRTLVLVVKKNPSILRNLLKLMRAVFGVKAPEVIDSSIIVIDDECDWGSLDVSRRQDGDAETDPSTINRLIRELLASFRRSAYVGYTGTPFANFLVSTKEHSEYGKDLFPEDFAILLQSPSNYLGVARLLGSKGSRLLDDEARVNHQGLPELIRFIDDNDWIKPGHKIGHVPSHELPPSLGEAIDRFIINCALRRDQHNSMLVNLTRFQSVQDHIKSRVETALSETVNSLLLSPSGAAWDRLELLFERIKAVSVQISLREPGEPPITESWTHVRQAITEVADRIVVKAIHGTSQEVLRYASETPVYVIAIGGQKLSRGLTLEGLTISYFERPANNYDTALQMGRWFGYRQGYLSLCRLYIDEQTLDSYRKISEVCETLREDLSLFDGDVSDLNLSFRKASNMNVTDRAKRQNSVTINTTLDGRMPETKIFHTDRSTREANIMAASNLLSACGSAIDLHSFKQGVGGRFASVSDGAKLFLDVERHHILRFLREYTTHPSAEVVRADNLADFITNGGQQGPDALRRWNVAFMSGNPDTVDYPRCYLPNGMSYVPRLRSPDSNFIKNDSGEIDHGRYMDKHGRYVIKRIVTETDEGIDVDAALANQMRIECRDGDPVRTDWIALRRARERSGRNGLLLIYPITPELTPPGAIPMRKDWSDMDVPFMGFALVIPGKRGDTTQVMSKETAMKRQVSNAR